MEQGMISLISILKAAVCLDDAHEVTIPLSVTCCIHCAGKVVLTVFKKEAGAIGRRIKIRCARNCEGWALEMPNTDDRNRRFKKVLGYISTYYETHK
jgi:hypothetical protein